MNYICRFKYEIILWFWSKREKRKGSEKREESKGKKGGVLVCMRTRAKAKLKKKGKG